MATALWTAFNASLPIWVADLRLHIPLTASTTTATTSLITVVGRHRSNKLEIVVVEGVRPMPTMPAKGLDRFVDTLTWKKAVKAAEKAKRGPTLKEPRQVSFLCYLQRGLSLQLVISYGGSKSWRALTYRDGKPHYWKLGNYPQMTVKEA